MGLQLSILVGCIGAVEILACLRHVFVCILKLTDQPSHCYIDYFHRSNISEKITIIEASKTGDDDKQVCNEIEAIFREKKSEPGILCIDPPVPDAYVRIPTPLPFDVDNEICQKTNSDSSSLVDSGNENPTLTIKQLNRSSSDISSVEDTESPINFSPKRFFRRSKTPEIRVGSCDHYDEIKVKECTNHQKKHHKSAKASLTVCRRSVRSKLKPVELGKSVENLSTNRRSKRHREPERCKSDIQLQVTRNLLRDEWTNTSPSESNGNLSKSSSKKSISVLVQTSFEDKLQDPQNNGFQTLENGTSNICSKCSSCRDLYEESRVRRATATDSVSGKQHLLKISSFEEASGDDYEKIKSVIASGRERGERIKSSVDSESFDDEYVDAEEDGLTSGNQPIQYHIPDSSANKAFWVNHRSHAEKFVPRFPT